MRRRVPLLVAPLAWALVAWALASPVAAQDAPAVDLIFVGDAIDASGLAPTLEELLGRVDVTLRQGPIEAVLDPREVLTPRPDARPALARIWIELAPDRTTIYFVDGEWERILVRHVPTDGGLDEVSREQVALIVHGAVEALLAGARIGLTRREAGAQLGVPEPPEPPPSRAPEPEPPPPSELGADVYLGYMPQLFADGPTLRHAVALYGTLLLGRASPRVALSLGLDVWPTTGHEAAGIHLDLMSALVRFEVAADLALLEDTFLRVGGGLALDVTSIDVAPAEGSPVDPAASSDAVGTVLTVRVGVHQRLFGWLALTAGIVLDVDLLDTRYVVQSPTGDRTVLDPWLVRPALWLGAGAVFR